MIGVIFGEKGTGKTKRILDMANKAAKEASGNLVFIDNDISYMYDLASNIRFINAAEYGIKSPKMAYGFLCGLSAQDFDLQYIFIDGILNITHHDAFTLSGFFESLKAFSEKHDVNIVMSMTARSGGIPPFVQELLIQDA